MSEQSPVFGGSFSSFTFSNLSENQKSISFDEELTRKDELTKEKTSHNVSQTIIETGEENENCIFQVLKYRVN